MHVYYVAPPNETIHTHTKKSRPPPKCQARAGHGPEATQLLRREAIRTLQRAFASLFLAGILDCPPHVGGVPPQKLAAGFPTGLMDPQALGPRAQTKNPRRPLVRNSTLPPKKGGTNRSLFERLVFKDDST